MLFQPIILCCKSTVFGLAICATILQHPAAAGTDDHHTDAPTAVQAQMLAVWGHPTRRLNGPDASLAALSGDVTVLHFWASWCAPCRDELPKLQRFHDAHGASLAQDGIRMITISNDFLSTEAERLIARSGLELPTLLDPRQTINLAFIGQRTLPLTLVVLPDGSVDVLAHGPVDWASPGILERLRAFVTGQKF